MKARDNPFSTDRVQRIRYRLRTGSWDGFLDRLAALRYRAAIVGPEGSGKTTLLEDLEPKLAAAGFRPLPLRLDREHRTFAPGFLPQFFSDLTRRDIILFDGAEQLGRLAWRRFARRATQAGGLVITSHRPGLLPTLIQCSTDLELLQNLVADLIPDDEAIRIALPALFCRHRGNIRDALRELYDVFANRPDSTPPSAPASPCAPKEGRHSCLPIESPSGAHSCAPEATRIDSAGQECPALADSTQARMPTPPKESGARSQNK